MSEGRQTPEQEEGSENAVTMEGTPYRWAWMAFSIPTSIVPGWHVEGCRGWAFQERGHVP